MTDSCDSYSSTKENVLTDSNNAVIDKCAVEINKGSLTENDMFSITKVERRLDTYTSAVFMKHISLNSLALFNVIGSRVIKRDHFASRIITLLRQSFTHISKQLT